MRTDGRKLEDHPGMKLTGEDDLRIAIEICVFKKTLKRYGRLICWIGDQAGFLRLLAAHVAIWLFVLLAAGLPASKALAQGRAFQAAGPEGATLLYPAGALPSGTQIRCDGDFTGNVCICSMPEDGRIVQYTCHLPYGQTMTVN